MGVFVMMIMVVDKKGKERTGKENKRKEKKRKANLPEYSVVLRLAQLPLARSLELK